MIVGVFAFVLVAIILVMATLGAVLVVRFAIGGADRSRRVVAAALGGPLTVILPTFVVVIFAEGAASSTEFIGFGVLLLVTFGVIGWPVAHFSTRRLDRLTRFDPQVFD
jgi:type IV secretory pathway TrbD component